MSNCDASQHVYLNKECEVIMDANGVIPLFAGVWSEYPFTQYLYMTCGYTGHSTVTMCTLPVASAADFENAQGLW